MKINKIYTGSKFYRFEEGSDIPEVIRIRNVDYEKNIVKYFDSDNNKCKISYSDLTIKYKMLAPDGLMTFSSVQVNENPDVIVALKAFPKNTNELENMSNLPYAICRQMVTDFFALGSVINSEEEIDMIYGVSVSQDTCPSNINYNFMLACSSLDYTKMIAVYLDDNLDTILSLFNNTRFDQVFETLNKKYNNAKGIVKSLKQLLIENNFMYDFRKCFKIIEIPFEVDEEYEGLNTANINYLSQELKVNIVETYVVRYDRTIDLSKIKRDYVLVSSAQENHEKIYIVGYDKV